MLGVFVANVYIGLYDVNIRAYNLTHYYLNWVIVVVDAVAAIFLFVKNKSDLWIALSGIAWPIAYLLSLGGDVATSMCLGTPTNTNCWPTQYDAFRYLILGDPSEGWLLWPYTMPTAIALLVIAIVLSVFSIRHIQSSRKKTAPTGSPAPSQNQEQSAQGPMQNS